MTDPTDATGQDRVAAADCTTLIPGAEASKEPSMAGAKLKSWACLVIGESVEIVRGAEVVCAGYVDDVSLSGNVLWIGPFGSSDRLLFVADDGVRVRRMQ
ncbi:hypothetical protein [Paenarthrobacter sp. PH39-S1]|uniref:hypothetical protein n=1 Tax=Paenarthrobacter sp. PH39-S1 TaxID=3046204 RepID=UPI0024B92612|nr:hypothetical protein [Paenarthrobacter sp. PH39-S1]MDJ0354930.1 hypothetical protein [Paenarthrobacter sp. PH39-S1]